MSELIGIKSSSYVFKAQMEEEKAPKTCDAIRKLLPLTGKILHARWSGEAVWIPFGKKKLDVMPENHTSYPQKGEIVVYPGGISAMEIFIPYGQCVFTSKVGLLPANHFMTIIEGMENLPALGHKALWEGSQDIHIKIISD
jgi:hypothetical protein